MFLITIVLSFANSLSRTSLYFSLKTSFVYSNLFSLSKTVTVNSTEGRRSEYWEFYIFEREAVILFS